MILGIILYYMIMQMLTTLKYSFSSIILYISLDHISPPGRQAQRGGGEERARKCESERARERERARTRARAREREREREEGRKRDKSRGRVY